MKLAEKDKSPADGLQPLYISIRSSGRSSCRVCCELRNEYSSIDGLSTFHVLQLNPFIWLTRTSIPNTNALVCSWILYFDFCFIVNSGMGILLVDGSVICRHTCVIWPAAFTTRSSSHSNRNNLNFEFILNMVLSHRCRWVWWSPIATFSTVHRVR